MFETVVVGTDGSQRAEKAVREAVELAKNQGARLHLVAAFSKTETHWETVESSAKVEKVDLRSVAETVLARSARRAEEQGVEVTYAAAEGDPAEVILDAADSQGADVIVLGNKGVTGAKRFFLGSVPDKVFHHAPCSVLVVRTD